MDKKKRHIDKEFISREDIKKYLEGTLSNAEQHRIEKILLEEGLEAEAMEGISTIEANQVEEDLNSLQEKLHKRFQPNKKFAIPVWRVAAAVLLLGLLSVSVYYLLEQQPNDELISLRSEKTENDIVKEESTQIFEEVPDYEEAPTAAETSSPSEEETEVNSYESKHDKSAKAIEKQDQVSNSKSTSTKKIMVEDEARRSVTVDEDASKALITKTKIDIEKDAQPVIAMRNNAEMADEVMAEDAQPMARMKKSEMVGYSSKEKDNAKGGEVVLIDYPGASEGETSYLLLPVPSIGKASFDKYVRENIHYPTVKNNTGTVDTVVVVFTVAATGEIMNLHIDSSPDRRFAREVKRLILEGPKWQHAIKDGEPVEKEVRVRIMFSPLD